MEGAFDPEVVWPGVRTAHSLVERSYTIMLERLDAVENRIQALQTLVITFKKTALYWAGMHYEANVLLVNRKGHFLTVMSTLFAVEVLFLLFWLIDQI